MASAEEAQLSAGDNRTSSPPTAGQIRSFPLIALVQLATFLAGLVACIDGHQLSEVLNRGPFDLMLAASAVLGACASVGLIGVIIGMSQLQMNRSALIGGGVGA